MSTTTTETPQHLEALERANRLRFARARIKRQIAAGDLDVIELLEPGDPFPPELTNMAVADLLRAQHRWGHTRSRKLLRSVAVSERRPLGELTDRQRRALVTALRGQVDYSLLVGTPLHAAA